MLNMRLVNRGTAGEVLLSGCLDTYSAEDAAEHLLAAAERFDTLTLNLEELEYISSTGLRALRRVYLAMHRKGGALFVSHVSKSVMEVFEMTGFASMLQFA